MTLLAQTPLLARPSHDATPHRTAPHRTAAGKDINDKEMFVGRAQKKAEREAMLRAK